MQIAKLSHKKKNCTNAVFVQLPLGGADVIQSEP